ncbi:leucyl aminopeptidase family protein [Cucumibacter marinus]|uniref:leucyl aminopeptidase family protein n=1 Tax=Cucumibacter marinus TaxID=1121252 RepID=UPI0004275319|nr:leucyl aminopeptidase family protein [Cucumibacter marinus]
MPDTPEALPIHFVAAGDLADSSLSEAQKLWAARLKFDGQFGRLLPLPDANGHCAGYLFGIGKPEERGPMVAGLASLNLQPGRYALDGDIGDATQAALAFRLGAYRFERYKKGEGAIELDLPDSADADEVNRLYDAAALARDLVNTPANDLGPENYEAEARKLAKRCGASIRVIKGEDLLAEDFPMIHAVGKASAEAPRLVELTWGQESDPKVTLVGKGVTFDTGGLDIKPPANMLLMKKDMGGSANILGLAQAIMQAGLKLRLKVLVPMVENAISGNAFRPGDILTARGGQTVEIGNTDAEGRLVLADALTLADSESPELILDMATLTGAARVALGPDIGALFSTDDVFAEELMAAGLDVDDPLWRMPLWPGYDRLLASKVADTNNISGGGGYGGAITAALFLKRFVKNTPAWAHLDIYSWTPEPRAGRTVGGMDQGLRAAYQVLKERYPAS